MRLLVRFTFIVIGSLVVLTVAPLSLWLFFRAQTATGWILACGGMALTVLLACLYAKARSSNRALRWGTRISFAVVLALLAVVIVRAPTGIVKGDSPVRHRFTKPVTFPRYSIANIVPEVEQANLAYFTASILDPIFTRKEEKHLSSMSTAIYAEMEQDENFHELGSAMGWCYADVFGLNFDPGHYYLYVPKHKSSAPMPVVLFLHGSAGNFKTYLWLWSKLAEQEGLIIVAPSGGFGNWRPQQTTSAMQALADAATVAPVDTNRVYLAGLSNGGLGVCRLASSAPERFRGLILISPVLDTTLISRPQFQEAWRGRDIAVLTGAVDDRIPLKYVEENMATLKASGVDVSMTVFPNEDHFLIYSQWTNMMTRIADWMHGGEK